MSIANKRLHDNINKIKNLMLCVVSFFLDPLPPSQFEVRRNTVTSTSFQVSWKPSLGWVDEYELHLLNDKREIVQKNDAPGSSTIKEATFTNLNPGTKYIVSIKAISGMKSTPTIFINASTGKSPVIVITVYNYS